MVGRWLLYLVSLTGCIAFAWANHQWFSSALAVGVLCLPLFSLLMSLPAMLTLKVRIGCPHRVQMQIPVEIRRKISCPLPAPAISFKIRVKRVLSGETWLLSGDKLPTEHCGQLECFPDRVKVYDYLGLFCLPMKHFPHMTVTVEPQPLPVAEPPKLREYLSRAWRPKPGGGYSENHELRLYRPGDSLNQIHWKLSAKTGKLILREPMEPERGKMVLDMELRGTDDELDRKFGRLLYLSRYLLEIGARHELRVLTGDGVRDYPVCDEESLLRAVDDLLGCPCAKSEAQMEPLRSGGWLCRIGGEPDEA